MSGVDLFNTETLDVFKACQKAAPFAGDINVLEREVDYPLLRMMMRNLLKVNGPAILGDHVLSNPKNARAILPGETRQYTIAQHLAQFEVPFRKVSTYCSVLEDEVVNAMSNGIVEFSRTGKTSDAARKVIDLKNAREASVMVDLGNELEDQLLYAPADSSDTKSVWGIWAWLAKPTTAQESAGLVGGHYGWAPTYQDGNAMSTRAGITCATATTDETANYANYTDVWSDTGATLTEADIQTLLRTKRRVGFTPPLTADDFLKGRHGDLAMLTNETVYEAAELKARANNDQLYADLGQYSGQVVIKGSPLMWTPKLDDDTDNPVIFLDWAHMRLAHPDKAPFRQIPARRMPYEPDAFVWDTDWVINLVVNDIRRFAVVSQAV